MKNETQKLLIIAGIILVIAVILTLLFLPGTKQVSEATVTIYLLYDMHAYHMLQGHSYCLMSNGLDVIRIMNAAGYDAMAVGNHEFDYGPDAMYTNFSNAEFPVLAANIQLTGDAERFTDVIDDYTVVAGGYLSSLGKIDLHFNKDGTVDITSTDAMPYSFSAETPQDEATLKVIEDVRKSQEQIESVVIGRAAYQENTGEVNSD